MVWRYASALLDVALWPAALAHEATHLLVLLPWLSGVTNARLHPVQRGQARLDIHVSPRVPRWALATAAIAPPVFGSGLALAVILWVALGAGRLPATAADWGLWLAASAYWIAYTAPSREDLQA